ncbi:MAG: hypothetical protein IPH26_06235 [Sterolibacteriaceae bacterium]|uniref:Uncharacterized protein n=1 Tax=Candidatus Methylophosphatis roskildensis TaxID=2899263 RepID=A0A9D7HTC7_9PROT|nr:hypothetical protein [Candidatus Methylophosphatis roskildensis]MBK7235930.1 hypothetical protein [Sterolibacteriaceae bacterium]
MNTKAAWILGLSIALTPAAWATAAQGVDITQAAVPADDAPAPATFDVFIDGVTGYAFVRTPAGWKFVRSLLDENRCESGLVQR